MENENKVVTKEVEEVLLGHSDNTNSAAYRSQQLCKNAIDSVSVFLALKDYVVIKQKSNKLCKSIFDAISAPMIKWHCTKTFIKMAQEDLAQYNAGHCWDNMDIVGFSDDGDGKLLAAMLQNNYESTGKIQGLLELAQAIFTEDKGKSTVYSFFDRVKTAQENYNKDENKKHDDNEAYRPNIVPALDPESLWVELRNAIADIVTVDITGGIAALDQFDFVTNLDKWVAEHPQTTVGLDEEIKSVTLSLGCRTKKSCILVGPAGTGKTTVIYELVQRKNAHKSDESLFGLKFYSLDVGALNAGTGLVGSLEAKVKGLINVLKANPDVILFIDEIHMINSSLNQQQNLASMFKPAIGSGEIVVVGATTNEEYQRDIEKDKAFSRRFRKVFVNEPNREQTIKICKIVKPVNDKYFTKEMGDELIERIVDLGYSYSIQLANPDKSLQLLELAYSEARIDHRKDKVVSVDDLINAVALQYHITIKKNKAEAVATGLRNNILGQDDAINCVIGDVRAAERGIVDKKRPLLSLFFAGPTGVGKTESARILAKEYFGEDCLIKLNMGEYSDPTAMNKLTGSGAGYVGYDDEPDLIKGVRQHPNCVVLFDEIEKAHPLVIRTFLSMLDDGTMKDNHGNMITFRNAIVIFTSNIGFAINSTENSSMGLMSSNATTAGSVKKTIEAAFPPEFIGRLNDIIVFKPLGEDIARRLIEKWRDEFAKNSGSDYKFSEEDCAEIVKACDLRRLGARSLKDCVRRQYMKAWTRSEGKDANGDESI